MTGARMKGISLISLKIGICYFVQKYQWGGDIKIASRPPGRQPGSSNYRREAALRRELAGKGTSYFGCPAIYWVEILLAPFPPGYLLVATLEFFHIRFLTCPSAEKEGSLSVLGVLHLWIGQISVAVL